MFQHAAYPKFLIHFPKFFNSHFRIVIYFVHFVNTHLCFINWSRKLTLIHIGLSTASNLLQTFYSKIRSEVIVQHLLINWIINFNFFVIIRLNVFKLHFILAWVNWVFKLWLTFLNLRVNISHLILIIAAVRSLIIATLLICRFRKTKIWVIAFKSTTEMPCSVMSPKIQKECIMGRCDLPHEWLLILNEVFALCFFDIRAWDHWWSRLNWIFNLVFIEMLTLSSIRELWYIWLILNWYWKCVLLQI